MGKSIFVCIALLLALLYIAVPAVAEAQTPTATISPTPTNLPSPTATLLPTPTPSTTPTPTATTAATATTSPSPLPTVSPTPTGTVPPSAAPSPTPTLSPTPTASPSLTPTPSPSPTATTTPPPPISDLACNPLDDGTLQLIWTSTGSGSGAYDIRYSTAQMDEASWDDAIPLLGAIGVDPGQLRALSWEFDGRLADSVIVGGDDVPPGQAYYFRLRVADELPHWSDLSNEASCATPLPEPLAGWVWPVVGTLCGLVLVAFVFAWNPGGFRGKMWGRVGRLRYIRGIRSFSGNIRRQVRGFFIRKGGG